MVVVLLLLVIIMQLAVVVPLIAYEEKTVIENDISRGSIRLGEWIGHQFAGIEQPNDMQRAYAPVLKMNIAYEQTKKPRRQRIDDSQAPATTEGEYEPVHEYEDVLPHAGKRLKSKSCITIMSTQLKFMYPTILCCIGTILSTQLYTKLKLK